MSKIVVDQVLTNVVQGYQIPESVGHLLFPRVTVTKSGGKVVMFTDKDGRNPPSELTAGRIRIGYKFTPIFPMERITFEREVTGEFLLNLKSVNLGGL
ncbi:hypothetical protein LP123_01775 [Moraxella bovis]|uniref:Uncharacterized protein n=1 Tax=Moraxella bovis TaxID=476 RepID=A0AAQ2T292_MORBO|nr:hypothetical protein [Moraxella bovis]AWY21258.1 hypothetical protein DQF64_12660 [Moraxella bovis]UYZ75447.1 hypothetical protein LP093_12050 [Moraxella bovis]UYZ78610.1 hypothetical protein LP115_01750 [Moraxella bovis]UYZ81503.1 hypothetical protein LP113_01780 [Moraxella bovis]UYZ87092.1 hypothetical protein LP094_01750 [Moraxella bovis]